MRDRRLGHGELLPEPLAGTLFLAGYGFEQRHAPGIGERFSDELELFVSQRPRTRKLTHSLTVIELSYSCQEVTPY
jgi:hypothetical protein